MHPEKRNVILIHGTTWVSPENNMLSEINRHKRKKILYDSTHMQYWEQATPQRNKVERGLPGSGGKWMGELL